MPGNSSFRPPQASDRPSATGVLSSLRLVSACTFASRILGLVRDVAMATLFGTGAVFDAFSVAFRIPNLARRLFGEGALTAAFLPIFVRELEHSGQQSAWRLASAVLTLLALLLSAVVVLGELALWLVYHFLHLGEEASLLVGLTATLLPYLIFICLVAQVSAILHALNHFTWPALLPVLLNVVWIAAIWLVAPLFVSQTHQVYAIAGCITIAGVLQLLAPLPTLRRLGFRYDTEWRAAKESVSEIVRIVLPVLVGLSITQLNGLCDSLIAWGFARPDGAASGATLWGAVAYPFESGTASALYLGQRLYQFPLGVFGVALSTVLFPLLSRHAQRGETERLRDDLCFGLRLVVVVGLPSSVGLVLIASPLSALLFQYKAFDAEDARQTAQMIAAYGIGVWAYCGLLILNRAYYAIGDRQTPVRVGVAVVVLNLVLNLTLIWFLGGRALALSTALCAMLQAVAAVWLFQHRVGLLDWPRLLRTIGKAIAATALMAFVCVLIQGQFPLGPTFVGRLNAVAMPLLAALLSYAAAAKIFGLDEVWSLLKRDHK